MPRKTAIRVPKIEMQARPRSLMIFASSPTLIVTRIVEPASITSAKMRMAYRILSRTASLKVFNAMAATFIELFPLEPPDRSQERPPDQARVGRDEGNTLRGSHAGGSRKGRWSFVQPDERAPRQAPAPLSPSTAASRLS